MSYYKREGEITHDNSRTLHLVSFVFGKPCQSKEVIGPVLFKKEENGGIIKLAKRIVSFLPSSTEILYELGLGAQITGVTHECKYPDSARRKPRVINASIDCAKMSSSEIDSRIGELSGTGGEIYVIDSSVLKEAMPDLIIAQGVCKVCAPHTKEIQRAFEILGYKPDLIVLDPHDLDDILNSIDDVAKHVGKPEEGFLLVSKLRQRIKKVEVDSKEKLHARIMRPRVLCIEWIDPIYVAGHWIPQMVEIAGGINGLSSTREPSRRICLDEIFQYQPDKIILMPCGFEIDRTCVEMNLLNDNDEWKSLDAVKRGEVYVVNANAYFSKPGPRIVVGLEMLAKIIDPETFAKLEVPSNSYRKLI
jgi:iron complex transport system substrate-binding protein